MHTKNIRPQYSFPITVLLTVFICTCSQFNRTTKNLERNKLKLIKKKQ